jgi:hypothetical protein
VAETAKLVSEKFWCPLKHNVTHSRPLLVMGFILTAQDSTRESKIFRTDAVKIKIKIIIMRRF